MDSFENRRLVHDVYAQDGQRGLATTETALEGGHGRYINTVDMMHSVEGQEQLSGGRGTDEGVTADRRRA